MFIDLHMWLFLKKNIKFILKKIGIIMADYTESYSQVGEDMVLYYHFQFKKDPGFYVDVGAHHPTGISNTYVFYDKKKWSGINIDPMPGMKKLFDSVRPRDINLEIGVSDKPGQAVYNMFDMPAVNTIDQELAKRRDENEQEVCKKTDSITVKTDTLENVLNKYCVDEKGNPKHIDFMSIDVEGHDLNVLRSNDWKRFQPDVILVENEDFNIEMCSQDPMHQFLISKGYTFFSQTMMTVFYTLR